MKKAGIIIVIVAAASFAGWRYSSRKSDSADQKYRTAVVDKGDVIATVTASGTVSAVTTVQVGSQVSGVIASMHADFNSRVTKGQLIAALDPTPFEAQVEQRRADLTRAEVDFRNSEITLNRQQRLVDQGLTSQADLDGANAAFEMARAQVAQSTAALEQARTNLQYTKIRSPIDGIVVAREYDIGQTVAASFQAPTLFTIAQDLTKMQVQADVDQADIGRVSVGQLVRFTVDAYPDEDFRGAISQIRLNAQVNQNVVTYPVMIEVPNPDERLRPTMTANVTIEVSKVEDVLRIPNAALRFRPEEGAGSDASGPAGRTASAGQRAAAGERNARSRPPSLERAAAGMGQRTGGMGGASRAFDSATMKPQKRTQTIYTLSGDTLSPVEVRTGITDGRFTQIVDGKIKPGDVIVVGIATAKASNQTGPGGMGGFGRRR